MVFAVSQIIQTFIYLSTQLRVFEISHFLKLIFKNYEKFFQAFVFNVHFYIMCGYLINHVTVKFICPSVIHYVYGSLKTIFKSVFIQLLSAIKFMSTYPEITSLLSNSLPQKVFDNWYTDKHSCLFTNSLCSICKRLLFNWKLSFCPFISEWKLLKKTNILPQLKKVIVSVFGSTVDYLKKRQNHQLNYIVLLEHLNDAIKAKHPHLAKREEVFHHSSATIHTSSIGVIKFPQRCFKLLPHALYSSDLLTVILFCSGIWRIISNTEVSLSHCLFWQIREVILQVRGISRE